MMMKIVGVPRSGKTTLALDWLRRRMLEPGHRGLYMTYSNEMARVMSTRAESIPGVDYFGAHDALCGRAWDSIVMDDVHKLTPTRAQEEWAEELYRKLVTRLGPPDGRILRVFQDLT